MGVLHGQWFMPWLEIEALGQRLGQLTNGAALFGDQLFEQGNTSGLERPL